MRLFALGAVLAFVIVALAGCTSEPPTSEPTPQVGEEGPLAVSQTAATMGRWLPPIEGEVAAVSMALLHTGDVLYWSGVEAATESVGNVTFVTSAPQDAEVRLLDLQGAQPRVVAPLLPEEVGDLFCSGLTILPDGRLLAAGGTQYRALQEPALFPPLDGTRDARLFDPEMGAWSIAANMSLPRWYPSVLLAPNGTPVAASGIGNLFTADDLWLQWEQYDAAGDTWLRVPGVDHRLPLYPRLFEVPGGPLAGDLFYTTAATLWGPFGEHPLEADWSRMASYDLHGSGHTDQGLSSFGARQYANSIMLPVSSSNDWAPTIMSFGGSLQRSGVATPLTETIDLSTEPPKLSQGPDMLHARWHHNAVLLPDGSFMVVGGGMYDNVVAHGAPNQPILASERWNPDSKAWEPWANMTVPRMYHSSAILLPDGRVLAGGHVPLPALHQGLRDTANEQVVETRLQFFEPPYMFRQRPSIESAPDAITYGTTWNASFELGDDELAHVMLMRPGATTHAYDPSQRAIALDVRQAGDAWVVESPPNHDVAPPGWYMLTVATTHPDGPTPSEAVWLHLA